MKRAMGDPARLAQLPPELDRGGVAALMRAATPVPLCTPAVRELVKRRVRNTVLHRRRPLVRALAPVLVGLGVCIFGGVLGATAYRLVVMPRARTPEAAVAPTDRVPRSKTSAPPAAPANPTAPAPPPPPPAPAPAVERLAASDGRPLRKPAPRRNVAPPGESAPPEATPAAPRADAESLVLARAMDKLRAERDGAAALAMLDQHAARYPGSTLGPEAATLRVEALLLLGRKREALGALDRLLATPLPRSDERRVLRGELRGALGQWRPALEDFSAVLAAHAAGDALAERALWGRATARSHVGDAGGARADAAEYLRRFPTGHFAAEAARLLGPRP